MQAVGVCSAAAGAMFLVAAVAKMRSPTPAKRFVDHWIRSPRISRVMLWAVVMAELVLGVGLVFVPTTLLTLVGTAVGSVFVLAQIPNAAPTCGCFGSWDQHLGRRARQFRALLITLLCGAALYASVVSHSDDEPPWPSSLVGFAIGGLIIGIFALVAYGEKLSAMRVTTLVRNASWTG